jgi:hypothetical protein
MAMAMKVHLLLKKCALRNEDKMTTLEKRWILDRRMQLGPPPSDFASSSFLYLLQHVHVHTLGLGLSDPKP